MIPPSVQEAYAFQSPIADALLGELDKLFKLKDKRWFYTSRKKSLDSFEQKIESGTVQDPRALEDFVGAMVVVPMLTDVRDAIEYVEQFFVIDYRRPQSDELTNKKSSEFPFDDLRLYGRLRESPDLPPRRIDQMVFEIQIKTFLQHAWSIATHDLVYKYDRVSWARSRVAYQLKALLEHADISVSAIAELEASSFLQLEGEPESRLQGIITLVESEWPRDVLPFDRRRQAMNLDRLATSLGMAPVVPGLTDLLNDGRASFGTHPAGLTPYQCIVDYASRYRQESLRAALKLEQNRTRILVTSDILRRLGIAESDAPNALL